MTISLWVVVALVHVLGGDVIYLDISTRAWVGEEACKKELPGIKEDYETHASELFAIDCKPIPGWLI